MKRFFSFITNFSDLAGIVCLGMMAFVTILAVFFRYILNDALSWPEEVTRYLFIVCTYLGCSVVMATDDHLKMEILPMFCRKEARRILKIACLGISTFFFAWCLVLVFDMTKKVYLLEQTAISFNFSLWIIWACMVVSFALLTLQTLGQIWLVIFPVLDKESEK